MKRDFASRRFLLSCAALVIATFMQWMGKLDAAGNSYTLLVIGCVAGYITGDVAEKTSVHRTNYQPKNDDYKDRT